MSIPSVLQTNAQNENQAVRVYSNILEVDSFTQIPNQFGKARFVIPKKGTALSPDGALVFRAKWSGHNQAQNRSATFPRIGGMLTCLENARFFMDGKLLSETKKVGHRLGVDKCFSDYEAQCDRDWETYHLFLGM